MDDALWWRPVLISGFAYATCAFLDVPTFVYRSRLSHSPPQNTVLKSKGPESQLSTAQSCSQ